MESIMKKLTLTIGMVAVAVAASLADCTPRSLRRVPQLAQKRLES